MNRQNFDTESVSNYPLTIDRMAEMQKDIEMLPDAIAKASPMGDCIVSGCEAAGDAGYAIVGVPDGNDTRYELFEVKSGDTSGAYLKLTETTKSAENSDGDTVTVRTERVLEWTVNEPTSGVYVAYSGLKRLWLKKAAQDDAGWTACTAGTNWFTPVGGTSLRVQRVGGRVHLWGSVQYGLMVNGAWTVLGTVKEVSTENNVVLRMASNVPVLPSGYRPQGDLIVPVRYNGAVSMAVVNASGELLMGGEPELGDKVVIDTWYEL